MKWGRPPTSTSLAANFHTLFCLPLPPLPHPPPRHTISPHLPTTLHLVVPLFPPISPPTQRITAPLPPHPPRHHAAGCAHHVTARRSLYRPQTRHHRVVTQVPVQLRRFAALDVTPFVEFTAGVCVRLTRFPPPTTPHATRGNKYKDFHARRHTTQVQWHIPLCSCNFVAASPHLPRLLCNLRPPRLCVSSPPLSSLPHATRGNKYKGSEAHAHISLVQ